MFRAGGSRRGVDAENAVYSVIHRRAAQVFCGRMLSRTSQAAECSKLTAQELLELGVVERVLKEPKDPQKGLLIRFTSA